MHTHLVGHGNAPNRDMLVGRPTDTQINKGRCLSNLQDEGDGAVAYRAAVDNVWALSVPLEAAVNRTELEDYQVRCSGSLPDHRSRDSRSRCRAGH